MRKIYAFRMRKIYNACTLSTAGIHLFGNSAILKHSNLQCLAMIGKAYKNVYKVKVNFTLKAKHHCLIHSENVLRSVPLTSWRNFFLQSSIVVVSTSPLSPAIVQNTV